MELLLTFFRRWFISGVHENHVDIILLSYLPHQLSFLARETGGDFLNGTTMACRKSHWTILIFLLCKAQLVCGEGGEERYQQAPYTPEERVAEYRRRGHQWPLQDFVPNTDGWSRLMERRLSQIQAMDNTQQRWDGWIETMGMALTTPNFTEFGWGLTQGPPELTEELVAAIQEGLSHTRPEGFSQEIAGPNPPDFIDRQDLTDKVSNNSQGCMFTDSEAVYLLLLD
jgi:hypothetical protein